MSCPLHKQQGMTWLTLDFYKRESQGILCSVCGSDGDVCAGLVEDWMRAHGMTLERKALGLTVITCNLRKVLCAADTVLR